MEDKKIFQCPLAIIINFNNDDIIVTSGEKGPNNDEGDDLDWIKQL